MANNNMLVENGCVVAIYGLSFATEELLERIEDDYNIVGLLDGYRQSGTLYGKPIISMDQAIQSKVEAIIIVARPSSRRIIVNRIREVCKEHNIKLYDVHGNDLSEPASHGRNLSTVSGVTREEVLEQIDQSDVISFDIFDTLITRAVLYPTDVYELVEQKIVAKYGQGFGFSEKRQAAERELSRTGVPTFDDIYKELEGQIALTESELKEIQELEWQTELQVLLPRYDMCRVFRYALEQQKKVYLVSDMYYTGAQLTYLLTGLGITGYEKLLVSCDYGTTKEQGLFQVLKEEVAADRYLHIGDNYSADVKSAERNGITGVWIKSGVELFDAVYWAEDFAGGSSLVERVKQGLFIARLFNSPFALAKEELAIRSPRDLGYLLFAPILTDYCLWLYQELQNAEVGRVTSELQECAILFCARDGFLMKELFDCLIKRRKASEVPRSLLKTVYFLTSRISAVGAGLFHEQDILHVAELDFNGTFEQMLATRFSLTKEEIAQEKVRESYAKESVLKYKDVILDRACENRSKYLKYIEGLELGDCEIVFFDFVSSGTCQAALEKIMNRKMQGYYFIRVEDNYFEKKRLNIRPFYEKNEEGCECGIYEDYFVLENILTSPMPSLKGFDAEGNPEYLQETRSSEEINFVRQVHEGIVAYFEEYLDIMQSVDFVDSRKCSEKMLGLLHKIPIENDIFHHMVWDDSFYARTIGMKELM